MNDLRNAAAVLLLLSACEKPVERSIDQVCKPENDKKDVVTEGHFALDKTMLCSNVSGTKRCGLRFESAPGKKDGFSADIVEGDGANEIEEVKGELSDAAIKIHTEDGKVIGVGAKAKVSGRVGVGEKGVCYMYVNEIHAL